MSVAPAIAVPRSASVASAIAAQRLSRVYHPGTEAEVVALRDVDLTVARGEFIAIMGPSGSGKSTLMNILGCLDTPTGGTYRCDGIDVATLDAEERARLRLTRIGFVFQGFNLLSRMTAVENVMMPMGYAGVPVGERRPRALAALEQVGLTGRAHHRPAELSGGQQQRVAIARALINKPAILLADEPTGALDSHTGEEIMRLFHRLREEGLTVVLITHDAAVAANAERRCDMRDGELFEFVASPDAPSSAPTSPGEASAGDGDASRQTVARPA